MTGVMEAGRTLAMGQDDPNGSTRQVVDAPFGQALVELGAARPDVVGLTADLGKYTDILPFRDSPNAGRPKGRFVVTTDRPKEKPRTNPGLFFRA